MPLAACRTSFLALACAVAGLAAPQAALANDDAAAAEASLPIPLAVRYASKQQAGEAADFARLFRQWKSIDYIVPPAPPEAAPPGALFAAAPASLARGLRTPVGTMALTSRFGLRRHPILGIVRPHLGVDLAARSGAPVYATADGVVSLAGPRGGYGISIALDHAAGLQTRYGHLSRLNVAAGQRVRKGEVIGFVGSTGMSTGPHLHYETRLNGRPVNPLPLIHAK